MMTGSQIRQSMLMMLTGGALVVAGMALNHRPEAMAVPALPKPDELSTAFRQAAAQAIPSIVSIQTITKAKQVENPQRSAQDDDFPFRQFFGNDPRLEEFLRNRSSRKMMTPARKGMGSGFIIDKNGTILTNSHVVNGADEVRVKLSDGREYIAKEIKTDPRTDVAIVTIDAPDLKSIRLGNSRAIEVGDWVLAIGSPFGLDLTVTAGIISAKGRGGGTVSRTIERAEFLQTDAAINPGNSGGPLINLQGEVIGINTAIATESGGYDGIGFAIPTHIAGWVSHQLMTNGEVRRGYLGTSIAPIDLRTARQFKVKSQDGISVQSVYPGSPAEKAGLEPGDIVLSLDGQKIDSPSTLQGVVEQLVIGQSYPVEIIRDGKQIALRATIEELPKDFGSLQRGDNTDDHPGGKEGKFDQFGMDLQTVTKELARHFGLKSTSGLVVTAVQDGSVAERTGIRVGDVLEKVGNQIMNSIEDYDRLKDSLNNPDGVIMILRSTNGRRFYVVMKPE